MSEFSRITQNPEVMGGKPCIRGMRVTVGMIVGQIGSEAARHDGAARPRLDVRIIVSANVLSRTIEKDF